MTDERETHPGGDGGGGRTPAGNPANPRHRDRPLPNNPGVFRLATRRGREAAQQEREQR